MTHKPLQIAQLSSAQLLKVKKGLPVIIKQGSSLKVMLDELQHKRAVSAFKHGKGLTVILNQAMHGSGVFTDIGKVLGELGGEALGTFITGRGAKKGGMLSGEDVVKAFTIKGKGKKPIKGKGYFQDNIVRPVASHLIHKGLPMAGGVLGGLGGAFLAPETLGLSVPVGTLAGSTLGELAGHNLGRVTGYGKKGKGIGDAGGKLGSLIGSKLDSWFGTSAKPKRLGLRSHLMKKSRGGALFPASGGALYPASGIMC